MIAKSNTLVDPVLVAENNFRELLCQRLDLSVVQIDGTSFNHITNVIGELCHCHSLNYFILIVIGQSQFRLTIEHSYPSSSFPQFPVIFLVHAFFISKHQRSSTPISSLPLLSFKNLSKLNQSICSLSLSHHSGSRWSIGSVIRFFSMEILSRCTCRSHFI